MKLKTVVAFLKMLLVGAILICGSNTPFAFASAFLSQEDPSFQFWVPILRAVALTSLLCGFGCVIISVAGIVWTWRKLPEE
jgi:hypothetical protein